MTVHCGRSDRTRQAHPVSSNHRQTRARDGRGPVRPVPHGTGASGKTLIGAVHDEELIGRVVRPVTCDRTRPVAMGALWTVTGRWHCRVSALRGARPVMSLRVRSEKRCVWSLCLTVGAQ
jgi:hypothetical protein